jgi:transmembrane sensor
MTTFRATERVARSDIELLGTARFQVVHDSTRLFVVHARDLETTDVGTEFAIRAYEGEAERAVAVYDGSVSARSSAGRFLTAGVILQKGDIGVVDRSGKVDVRHDADISRLTEWERGRIAVNDRPLSQVAAELQRWFDVDIRIADPRLANRRVTAVYNAASLDNILAALSEGLGINVSTEGRVITLSSGARR